METPIAKLESSIASLKEDSEKIKNKDFVARQAVDETTRSMNELKRDTDGIDFPSLVICILHCMFIR